MEDEKLKLKIQTKNTHLKSDALRPLHYLEIVDLAKTHFEVLRQWSRKKIDMQQENHTKMVKMQCISLLLIENYHL